MDLHGALEAWQAGEIASARAMALTGAADLLELHVHAYWSGVEIRRDPLPIQEVRAAAATALTQDALDREEDRHPHR